MRYLISSAVLFIQLSSALSYGVNSSIENLITFETKANAVSQRSNRPVAMPHFEIPLRLLELDFAERFNPEHRKHLIFEKNGENYVRWILNPEDKKWFKELAAYYKLNNGLTLEKKYYFTGYQTASRSYVVEDPEKTISFSVKSSTDTTGGHWADKPQHADDADDSRKNADFLYEVQKHLKFENIVILDEPAVMKSRGANQAVVIRDLSEIQYENSGKIFVPGFSVLHDKTGRTLAEKNGSKDPYAFWTKNYIQATARALGELAARTGMQLDSPHSQNFLVEVTSDFKPTGRIVIRDMADFYVHRQFMRNMSPDHLNGYYEKSILDVISSGFGPLHGNQAPSWISDTRYNAWLDVFYKEFDKSFIKYSGLKRTQISSKGRNLNGKYFSNKYSIPAPDNKADTQINSFWENLKRYKSPRGILNCSYVFQIN